MKGPGVGLRGFGRGFSPQEVRQRHVIGPSHYNGSIVFAFEFKEGLIVVAGRAFFWGSGCFV